MKFSSVLSVFALAAASASALKFEAPYVAQGQKPIGALDKAIPGNSPVVLCSADPDQDKVTIDRIDLDPMPPSPGKVLHVEASGTAKERIEEGATVWVEVKLGYIVLIRKTFDFCEQTKEVDLKCPIEKGPVKIVKDVELPKEIPPGKFVVTAKLYNADEEQITCLKAEITFKR